MSKTIKYSISMEEFLSIAYVWQIEIEPILRQIQLKLKVSGNARLQKNWRHYNAYYLFLDKLIGKSIDCSQIKNKSVVRCMLMTANNLISFSKPPPALVMNDPSVGKTFLNRIDTSLIIKPPSMTMQVKSRQIIRDLLSINKAGQPIYNVDYIFSPIMNIYFNEKNQLSQKY